MKAHVKRIREHVDGGGYSNDHSMVATADLARVLDDLERATKALERIESLSSPASDSYVLEIIHEALAPKRPKVKPESPVVSKLRSMGLGEPKWKRAKVKR